jgi:ribosome-associated translation inhibitor RaiA
VISLGIQGKSFVVTMVFKEYNEKKITKTKRVFKKK